MCENTVRSSLSGSSGASVGDVVKFLPKSFGKKFPGYIPSPEAIITIRFGGIDLSALVFASSGLDAKKGRAMETPTPFRKVRLSGLAYDELLVIDDCMIFGTLIIENV